MIQYGSQCSTAFWWFFALTLHSGFIALGTDPFSLFVKAAFFFDHLYFTFFAGHVSITALRVSISHLK
jgi:hypothetical protein